MERGEKLPFGPFSQHSTLVPLPVAAITSSISVAELVAGGKPRPYWEADPGRRNPAELFRCYPVGDHLIILDRGVQHLLKFCCIAQPDVRHVSPLSCKLWLGTKCAMREAQANDGSCVVQHVAMRAQTPAEALLTSFSVLTSCRGSCRPKPSPTHPTNGRVLMARCDATLQVEKIDVHATQPSIWLQD